MGRSVGALEHRHSARSAIGLLHERTAISSKPEELARQERANIEQASLPRRRSRIDRHVPALPLSRDRERMEELKDPLVVYMMVFGQFRQEELAAFLMSCLDKGLTKEELHKLKIDLSPPRVSKLEQR